MPHLRRSFAMLLTATVIGCGDDPSSPRDQPFEGTYKLTHINGSALPFNTTMQGASIRVNSGNLVLRTDSTFTLTADVDATFFGQTGKVPVYNEGSYVRSGNDITFPFAIQGTDYNVSGTVSGGVLDLTTSDPAAPIQSMRLRRAGD